MTLQRTAPVNSTDSLTTAPPDLPPEHPPRRGILSLPARLSKLSPHRQAWLVFAALIMLWIIIPALIPTDAVQSTPILITATTRLGLIWFAAAVLATAASLVALGWRRALHLPLHRRGCLARLRSSAVVCMVLALWVIVPFALPGNLNRQPYILIRAANAGSLLWFILAVAAAGLACLYAGQRLAHFALLQRRRDRLISMVEQQIDAGIALFSPQRQLEYINMAGRFYLFQEGRLIDEVGHLIGRAQQNQRVTAQSFNIDERLRVNIQAIPVQGGGISVVARVLQNEADQNTFYERFIRRIVHDMRNPLAAIIAHASNLYHTPVAEAAEWQNAARTIEHEAQRLTRLVDSLLFDARLSFVPLAQERIDLVDVIEDVMFQHDERAMREGKRIEVETPPEPAIYEGDRDLLVRALGNVVDNSLKYSAAGSQVRIVLEALAGVYLLRVIDTGDGIPPEYLPHRIFEPLVRARKDGIGGSGLGLSIVKKIVEMHGGSITVDSAVGRGTTMTITLRQRV